MYVIYLHRAERKNFSGLAYLSGQLRPGIGPTSGLRYPSGEAQLTLSMYHVYRTFVR